MEVPKNLRSKKRGDMGERVNYTEMIPYCFILGWPKVKFFCGEEGG